MNDFFNSIVNDEQNFFNSIVMNKFVNSIVMNKFF